MLDIFRLDVCYVFPSWVPDPACRWDIRYSKLTCITSVWCIGELLYRVNSIISNPAFPVPLPRNSCGGTLIMDETIQEEGCDRTRKEVQGKSRPTDGTKIGGEKRQEGERRQKYSAAVIEGIKRNATT